MFCAVAITIELPNIAIALGKVIKGGKGTTSTPSIGGINLAVDSDIALADSAAASVAKTLFGRRLKSCIKNFMQIDLLFVL